jgi:hypothetical protein
MQNGQHQSGKLLTTGAAGWTAVGTGDYNGDGTSDVLLQNGGTIVDRTVKNGAYQSGNVIANARQGSESRRRRVSRVLPSVIGGPSGCFGLGAIAPWEAEQLGTQLSKKAANPRAWGAGG